MNDTPTPRTDKIIQDGMIFDKDGPMLAALARELERDLSAAQERVRELDESLDKEIEASVEWRKRATKAESALASEREARERDNELRDIARLMADQLRHYAPNAESLRRYVKLTSNAIDSAIAAREGK